MEIGVVVIYSFITSLDHKLNILQLKGRVTIKLFDDLLLPVLEKSLQNKPGFLFIELYHLFMMTDKLILKRTTLRNSFSQPIENS